MNTRALVLTGWATGWNIRYSTVVSCGCSYSKEDEYQGTCADRMGNRYNRYSTVVSCGCSYSKEHSLSK